MTNEEALNVLDQATQPENAGKISRVGYVQANAALMQLAEAVKELVVLKNPPAPLPVHVAKE